jgi:hypothetical protein
MIQFDAAAPGAAPEIGSRVRPVALVATVLFALVVAGCSAGSGEGLDAGGRPTDGDVPLAPTLESIQANVFNAYCVICHAGAAAPQGLRLDAANSYNYLVGVPSREVGSLLRVEPGNPDDSYLIHKLEGRASEGDQMPLGGPPLPDSTIAFVRQWIADGALPDSPDGNTTPPVVVSLEPAPDSTATALPAEITIGFDQDIDASTINSMTVVLDRSGGDGDFADGDEETIVPDAVSLSPTNARLAVMDLTSVTSVDDVFRLTVRGSGANVVLDLDAQALDGEYSGSLPSGDGSEGGDFVATFTVEDVQPTLDSIQANVFTPICSTCHTGPTGDELPEGMDLSSADASFASLVGVASLEVPTDLRVAAGDANASYLVHKIEGTAAVGERMPLDLDPLDPAVIDAIREWIDAGAAR